MNVTVTARRWEGGWELWIDEDHVTQSSTLADAEQQVREYLDNDDDTVNHDCVITIVPDIGALADEVAAVRASVSARRRGEALPQLRCTHVHPVPLTRRSTAPRRVCSSDRCWLSPPKGR